MATYTDSFTYSDGNLQTVSGSQWIDKDLGLYVTSNKVRAQVGGSYNVSYYNNTVGNDQYAEAKVVGGTADNNTSWCGPAVRVNTTSGACYAIMYFANATASSWFLQIGYYDGNGLAAASTSYNIGSALATTDVLRLEVSGSNLTAKINGSTVKTWSDSTLTSGNAGILIYAWNVSGDFQLDDWGGGDLAGAAPTVTSAGTGSFYDGQTGIVVTGTGFGASQGTGAVYISPTNSISDTNKVTQTVTSWADTSITITAVRSTLPINTNLYLFVKENGSQSNATGFTVQMILDPIRMRWTV